MKNSKKNLILILCALVLFSGCSKKVQNDVYENTSVTQSESTTQENNSEKETPENTKLPDVSPTPEASETPEENLVEDAVVEEETAPSPLPPTSEAPAETQKPVATQKPAATQKPVATQKPATPPPATPVPQKKSPSDVMNNILVGVDTPNYELTPINEANFNYYMFTDYIDGAEGVSADALISSTAHSVCLVQLPDGVNAENVATQVKKNADPAKWVCVEAEAVEVATKDNMVLLVMSDSATTSQIINNFKKSN